MRAIFFPVIILTAVSTLMAAEPFTFPTAALTVQVNDETGLPLDGALVKATFQKPTPDQKDWGTGRGNNIVSAATDNNGLCTLSGHSDGELGGGVQKDGFYRGWWIPYVFRTSSEGKWQPWNPTVHVVMKKRLNPIPMYAKRLQIEIPASDQAHAFDLQQGDWVAPAGKGKVPDFVFALHRRFTTARDYEVSVAITFANPADGLQEIQIQGTPGSELKLPRTAPLDGYLPTMTTSIGATPRAAGHEDAKTNVNYFFRVRSTLDQNGRVLSGLYGKIDGDIRLDAINSQTCILIFKYYMNPTPNDRNLEFDVKRNLFTHLKDEERVIEP